MQSTKITFKRLYSNIFDYKSRLINREFALKHEALSKQTDYLKVSVASNLVERLSFIKREFNTIVDFMSGSGTIANFLDNEYTKSLIMCDTSNALLFKEDLKGLETKRIVLESEERLPFQEDSIEIVMSNLALNWINDLEKVFCEIHKCLKKDGVFLASMLGGDTLYELRTSLQQAETERTGGISARVSPFVKSNDIANLLQKSNFNLVTVDVEEVVVNFPSIFELLEDLELMGETNSLLKKPRKLQKQVLVAADSIYKGYFLDLTKKSMEKKDSFLLLFKLSIWFEYMILDRMETRRNSAETSEKRICPKIIKRCFQ